MSTVPQIDGHFLQTYSALFDAISKADHQLFLSIIACLDGADPEGEKLVRRNLHTAIADGRISSGLSLDLFWEANKAVCAKFPKAFESIRASQSPPNIVLRNISLVLEEYTPWKALHLMMLRASSTGCLSSVELRDISRRGGLDSIMGYICPRVAQILQTRAGLQGAGVINKSSFLSFLLCLNV